ncbi:hypothetical protein [Massilia sp.]|uniref:hypothetical protein n=1 Tax=Massilia sp. TaxID=1882437 RepID=UPI0028A15788|nr:hypothetical protein [Massilia sp.]
MPSNFRIIATSVLFFIIFGPLVPALEFTLATLFTKGRFEIMPAFFLAAICFGALIAAALGLAHGVLMAIALRLESLRRRLGTQRARVVLGAVASLLCGLAMTAATLYIARNSYGSLLGAMDPNNPDPWKIIRAYMVIELFILPALVCGILFQLLPWPRKVMQRALGQA